MEIRTQDVPLNPYNVKLLRMELGLTQREMARMVPVHAVTWGKWERGLHKPRGVCDYRIRQLFKKIGDLTIFQMIDA